METPFLSFANPNYQYDAASSTRNSSTESEPSSSKDIDVNILSMANQKQEKVKLQIGELGSQNSLDDEELSLKSDEMSSDEENDFVDSETKLLGENEDEKVDNSDCMNAGYGDNKPRGGILAYISLLEQSARERRNEKRKEKNNADIYSEECDSGQVTPMLNENIKEKM